MTAKDLAPELETEALDEAAAAEPGRTSAWSALEYRDFRLFWIGLVVSNIGTWMQQFGLGWLVVQLAIRDGAPQLAPFYLGLVGLARAVPGLAFGLFGGVVADRADRRRLLIMTQTSAAIVAAILGILTITDRINIVEVVLISALNSIIFSFDAPTRQAMVPRLVSDKELMSAIGLNSAAFNGATLVGPLVGGVLIIPFGVGGLMMINAATYLAIVGALLLMRPQPVESVRHRAMLESIREGLSFIRRDPVLRWVVTLSVATALLTRPYIQLLPAEAQFLGVGAVELSWLLAASGAGALGGALVTASLGSWRRRGALLVGAALGHGTLLMFFGLQHTVLGAMLFVGLTSFAVMVFLGMANTLMQTRTPDGLRGRVMSVHTMVFMGFMPLGQMLLGTLGTFVGINNAFLAGGVVVTLLAGYAALRVPALRDALATVRPRAVASS
ncbi:MAG TPA: MFS transporter [Candidatus Limnocylindria bacterium]|jgi:MFS family permease|nr:MFS transporter [Candidatus Limnocylindria bacterium]